MSTMNICSLLVAVATAVVCTSAIVSASAPSPAPTDPNSCPWRTVLHPELPFIQKLGSWAVHQEHTVMHFKKVESAKWQGVGQCTSIFFHNYYYELIIVAAIRGSPTPVPGGDDDEKFRAVVYVVNFTEPQKVISFTHYRPAGGQLRQRL